MAGRAQTANAAAKKGTQPAFTMQRLGRMALWGTTAASALLVAILTSRSDAGSQRIAATPAAAHAPGQFDAEAVTRQLAQAVRGLNEDRARLTTRLAALEQNLSDITGAIERREEKAPPPAAQGTGQPPTQGTSKTDGPATANAPAEDPPAAADAPVAKGATVAPPWPADDPPEPGIASSTTAAAPVVPPFAGLPNPLPAIFDAPSPGRAMPASASAADMPQVAAYGADLGSAVSIQTLQTRWSGARSAHHQLFAGLQAVATLKENPRSKRAELRLVVGPLPSPGAAVELCATLAPFHVPCQPTNFEGQHLALQ
jgi:hypothetical protein